MTKTKTFNEGKEEKKTIFREKGNFKKKELGVIVVDVMKKLGCLELPYAPTHEVAAQR